MRLFVALSLFVSLAFAVNGNGPVYPYGNSNGWSEPPCEHTTKIFFASVYTSTTGGLAARVNLSADTWDDSACRMTGYVLGLQKNQQYYFVVEANAQNSDGTYRQTNCWGCGATPTTDTRQDTCNTVPMCTFTLTTQTSATIQIWTLTTPNADYRIRVKEGAAPVDGGCKADSTRCAFGQCCNRYGECGTGEGYCDSVNCYSSCNQPIITATGSNPTPVSLPKSYSYNHKAWTDSANNWDHSGATPIEWSWGNGQYNQPKQWAAVDTSNSGSPNAFRITYPAGMASPNAGTPSGIGFYEAYNNLQSATIARLTYEVSFGNTAFSWNKGGKLPGFYGGIPNPNAPPGYGGEGCSGGDDGYQCFSCRLMWRKGGMGEAYIYYDRTMKQPDDLFYPSNNIENPDDGDSIGRGNFTFGQNGSGDFNKVAITIKLNDANVANGHLNVSYNDVLKITYTKLKWRKTSTVKFTGIMFTTFFGGADSSWAPGADQTARFRNFLVEHNGS